MKYPIEPNISISHHQLGERRLSIEYHISSTTASVQRYHTYTALIWAILMDIFKQLISTNILWSAGRSRIVLTVLIMMNESDPLLPLPSLFLGSNHSNKAIMKNNCLKAFIWMLFLLLTVAHSMLAILMR